VTKKRNEKSKIRAEFRKKHDQRGRKTNFTKDYAADESQLEDASSGERISGKGRLTRKRTVIGQADSSARSGFQVELNVDSQTNLAGRALRVSGLNSIVRTEQGDFECATRGLLKSLATDLQNVVVAGDFVTIEPGGGKQAVITRVEPRRNTISRTSKGKQQIIASNVDLSVIVSSAAQPDIKPNLIDRLLISAEKMGVQPVVVINKIDLIDPADLMPLAGVWSQLGYPVHFVSARTGQGMERLRNLLRNRESVVNGQSGVGKSSLLNAIDPALQRRVGEVSLENEKGKHTTTLAELIPLSFGGYIIDTPGIRQFQLWDIVAAEVDGLFRDFRPYTHRCRFPDCTHSHEDDCAVKSAVADGLIDPRRYDSYCQIRSDL
jgi:ribosome biogenesis GTPase